MARMNDNLLTKDECLQILNLYKNWNAGQKSMSLAFGGMRTGEDDLYDERRALIKAATIRLKQLCEEEQ